MTTTSEKNLGTLTARNSTPAAVNRKGWVQISKGHTGVNGPMSQMDPGYASRNVSCLIPDTGTSAGNGDDTAQCNGSFDRYTKENLAEK